jgi:hypothetical protein
MGIAIDRGCCDDGGCCDVAYKALPEFICSTIPKIFVDGYSI